MGAPIGTLTIPVLAPGEEVVLSTPWQMPNPNDYIDINPSPWHFCFLATNRIGERSNDNSRNSLDVRS